MPKRKKDAKMFVHGQVFSDAGEHVHITQGERWRVDGGTKDDHEKTVEVTAKFHERLEKEQPRDCSEAGEILKDVLKRTGQQA
jgi:hypothetical protein